MLTLLSKQIRRQGTGGRVSTTALAVLFCCGMIHTAASTASPARKQSAIPRVPRYHTHPPRGPLPQVLTWTEFAGNASAENAYYAAARIRPVLYQQPCYCPCAEELGHKCLLDCFTRPDKHAAICATCMQEAIFAYRQTMLGVTAQSIRAGIIRGEWKKVNLRKYNQPPE